MENDPNLSRDVVNSGKESMVGFLNREEFMAAILKGIGWTSFSSLGLAILLTLGESVHLWYTGPLAPTVIAIVGVAIGYLRTKRIGEKLLKEGDDNGS